MSSKITKKKTTTAAEGPKRLQLFDHVKAIRQTQSPSYYVNLSEDDRKTFNHFMILRALAMDDAIVEDIAQLYQVFDKIPSAQFYQLLIALVPRSNRYFPWVKSRSLKHNKKLLEYVSKRFQVARYQANEYVNILLRNEGGQSELVSICKAFGLDDKEVEELFEGKDSE